jgi:hypothetical protein
MRLLLALSALVFLSACSNRVDHYGSMHTHRMAGVPGDHYVWARNDGRRMSSDPALLRQGQADQAACHASASTRGVLNMPAFVYCMETRGYSRRRA